MLCCDRGKNRGWSITLGLSAWWFLGMPGKSHEITMTIWSWARAKLRVQLPQERNRRYFVSVRNAAACASIASLVCRGISRPESWQLMLQNRPDGPMCIARDCLLSVIPTVRLIRKCGANRASCYQIISPTGAGNGVWSRAFEARE